MVIKKIHASSTFNPDLKRFYFRLRGLNAQICAALIDEETGKIENIKFDADEIKGVMTLVDEGDILYVQTLARLDRYEHAYVVRNNNIEQIEIKGRW